jgi:hypothetical protein
MEKEIIEQAEKNAEQYDPLFRKAARAAFIEGAKWFQDTINKQPEKEYYGN